MLFETGPGIQAQGDWTECGTWRLDDWATELRAFVAILGESRMLAVRFATDQTRSTTLRSIVCCVDDLIGSREVLHFRPAHLRQFPRRLGSPLGLGNALLQVERQLQVVAGLEAPPAD